MSLLSWERGLKFDVLNCHDENDRVAPLVGAWIEMQKKFWILLVMVSLLSWERGLKYRH